MGSSGSVSLLLLVLFFSAVVHATRCPPGCDRHGECGGNGTCICENDYEGDDCSIYNRQLQSGEAVPGIVNRQTWRYYNLFTPTTQELKFNLTKTGRGDCGIYVEKDSFPTRSLYLARNISEGQTLTLKLPSSSTGTYYVGVYGFSDNCQFTLFSLLAGPCLDSCSNHGECVQGACHCYTGYTGQSCEVVQKEAQPDKYYDSQVRRGGWEYYTYTPREALMGIVWIMEETGNNLQEECDIYLREGARPTEIFYDQHNVYPESPSGINQTVVEQGKTYYFGVYGYYGCRYRFHFTLLRPVGPASCPNDCSLHSTKCFHSSCVCVDGYRCVT